MGQCTWKGLQLPGVYVACSDVFNDVASVAMLENGLVGFGAGIAIGTFELLVPWPGCGCEVTGPSSLKSSCICEENYPNLVHKSKVLASIPKLVDN